MKKSEALLGTVEKGELAERIEPFIFDLLKHGEYEIDCVAPASLLTWNRLDLAFKLLYLDLNDRNPGLAREIYNQDIRSQTLGTFVEHENAEKNSFEKYVSTFNRISEAIRTEGFDSSKSLVPLSETGAIFNGAHRVASAIHAGREITCVRTELPIHVCDYRFYQRSGVSQKIIEMAVQKFVEHAPGVFIAFLWPSGIDKVALSVEEFPDIIYKKAIRLSLNGGRNLLLELYKHMDWIGTRRNGYSGINQKLIECFPNESQLTMVVFQASTLQDVRVVKERIRAINGIGFSSVHITDTQEEAVRVSRLLLNKHGLHFLNNAIPDKFDPDPEIDRFKQFIDASGHKAAEVAIDGSFLLTLYGIRESWDVDFISDLNIDCSGTDYETHDAQLEYHKVMKSDLLYDPDYHFIFSGLKFISIEQLQRMKTRRGEAKDKHDVASMSRLHEPASLRRLVSSLVQKLFFLQLRGRTSLRNSLVLLLKKIGLYKSARRIYWKLMR